jgi:hypothetical protein
VKKPPEQRKRQEGGGPHPIDDEANLIEIARLTETEKITRREAALRVATVVKQTVDPTTGKTPSTSVEHIATRLYDKFKEKPEFYYERKLYADNPERLATIQARIQLRALRAQLDELGCCPRCGWN